MSTEGHPQIHVMKNEWMILGINLSPPITYEVDMPNICCLQELKREISLMSDAIKD